MTEASFGLKPRSEKAWLLGVDTCGASGSVALAELDIATGLPLLVAEKAIEGGEFAASLVLTIAETLESVGVSGHDLSGIVAVAGPGSFTGIRVGLATVKAIAEAVGLPVIAVSRLAALKGVAQTIGITPVGTVVLDAHRGQIYCSTDGEGDSWEEMLLTAGEINARGGLPQPVVVCEEAVAQMLEALLEVEVLRVVAPSAWDAIQLGAKRWLAGEFADIALLDGYYLRGADARMAGQ